MTPPALNEREFELINIIGGKLAANQRDLSRRLNLSLGMTNMVIRRLVTKGYIRIKQLNRRKVEYILTPKGFAEKMRKSVNYTLKTINSIGLIKSNLLKILGPLYQAGIRKFYILGTSDLAGLIDGVFKDNHLADYTIVHIADRAQAAHDGIILVCTEEVEGEVERAMALKKQKKISSQEINILEALAIESYV